MYCIANVGYSLVDRDEYVVNCPISTVKFSPERNLSVVE